MVKLHLGLPSRRIGRIWRGTLVGILIGVVSGLGAIVFNFLLQTGTRFFMQDLVGFILGPRAGQTFLDILSPDG